MDSRSPAKQDNISGLVYCACQLSKPTTWPSCFQPQTEHPIWEPSCLHVPFLYRGKSRLRMAVAWLMLMLEGSRNKQNPSNKGGQKTHQSRKHPNMTTLLVSPLSGVLYRSHKSDLQTRDTTTHPPRGSYKQGKYPLVYQIGSKQGIFTTYIKWGGHPSSRCYAKVPKIPPQPVIPLPVPQSRLVSSREEELKIGAQKLLVGTPLSKAPILTPNLSPVGKTMCFPVCF